MDRKPRVGERHLISRRQWLVQTSIGTLAVHQGRHQSAHLDGRTGRIREIIEAGRPVVLVTRWQSLYTQGTALGLDGLSALAERIHSVFGNSFEWVTCSEVASRYVTSRK